MDHINAVASSPFTVGIMILLTNVASRYIVHEFSTNEEEYGQNILLRRLAIFAVCFVGTRNLVVSVLLTAGFVILAGGLFRGSSVYSREGMHNSPDRNLRSKAGLKECDQPAYDSKQPPMF
jgi:protein-S-isoprenylcysteine O-methyltransferase Ste14